MEIRQKPNQKVILRKNGSLDIGSINTEPTLAQQQFKEQCDINNIIKQYQQTGELPLSGKVGQFLDVSNIQDYHTSLLTVYEAQKAFDNLPSNIRSRFENDPNQLLAFIEDDKNTEEAQKLGLTNTKYQTPQNQNQNQTPQNPIPTLTPE
jgi:phage internal scaffolding protein